MQPDEILRKLLQDHFYVDRGLEWNYQEDTTLGDVDPELEQACLEFLAVTDMSAVQSSGSNHE